MLTVRRIGKESDGIAVPKAAEPLVAAFSRAFTRPTFQGVVLLIFGAILWLRRHTVTAMLWPKSLLAQGHGSDFYRVFCRASWSLWPLGKVWAALILEWIPPDQPMIVPLDDSTPQHKGGGGLLPVRWVLVHDGQGTHGDEYLYSTGATLRPEQIVNLFTGRWSIEVTFQEVRAHLGFTTPRNGSKKSVPRTAPCLLGLFSLVSLVYARQVRNRSVQPLSAVW